MDNSNFYTDEPLYLAITEDKKTSPVIPFPSDFYYSMEFLREHGDQMLTGRGGNNSPLWEVGRVSSNSEALTLYFQLANVPADLTGWGMTLYKIGDYYLFKIFDANRKEVYRRVERESSDPYFMIALAIATGGAMAALANTIGTAVVGSQLAAAYPALTTALGQVAISTAISGGDVAGAVKSVAIGSFAGAVGGYVGGQVTSATNLDLMGKIAAGATSSVIRGGNILIGAAGPLVSSAANFVVDSFSTPTGGTMNEFYDDYSGDEDYYSFDPGDAAYGTDPVFSFDGNFSDMVDYNYAGPIDTGMPPIKTDFSPDYFPDADGVFTFGDFGGFGDTSSNYHDPAYDDTSGGGDYIPGLPGVTPEINFPDSSSIPDPSIFLPDFQTSGGSNVPTTSGGTDWGAALARLGTIALQVYQQQGNKNIKAVSQSVRLPDGSVQVVNKNGTVTTRTPSGQTTTTQLPPGQPYRFPDGSVVMNNGNGTYTQQTASGQIATQQYGSLGAGGMGGVSLPILAGGALLLLLVMKK